MPWPDRQDHLVVPPATHHDHRLRPSSPASAIALNARISHTTPVATSSSHGRPPGVRLRIEKSGSIVTAGSVGSSLLSLSAPLTPSGGLLRRAPQSVGVWRWVDLPAVRAGCRGDPTAGRPATPAGTGQPSCRCGSQIRDGFGFGTAKSIRPPGSGCQRESAALSVQDVAPVGMDASSLPTPAPHFTRPGMPLPPARVLRESPEERHPSPWWDRAGEHHRRRASRPSVPDGVDVEPTTEARCLGRGEEADASCGRRPVAWP